MLSGRGVMWEENVCVGGSGGGDKGRGCVQLTSYSVTSASFTVGGIFSTAVVVLSLGSCNTPYKSSSSAEIYGHLTFETMHSEVQLALCGNSGCICYCWVKI